MIKMNAAEFNQSIQNFSRKLTPKQYGLFVRGLAMKILRGVVKKTPVRTGRARGNWQVNVGSYTDQEIMKDDSSGSISLAAGMAKLSALKNDGIGQIIYIYNNVPYIIDLEDGHSKQAPAGMVGVTFAEIATGFGV